MFSNWLATSPTSVTTTIIDTVSVITPKDFENACRVPVAVTNVAIFAIMFPINAIAIFAFYTKLTQSFNPNHIEANIRHKRRNNRINARIV
jgi:hypothetical protein